MGNVIVAAFLIVGAGVAATVVIITQGPALGLSVDSMIESQISTADMIQSDIEIVSVEPVDTTTIVAWVRNTGSTNIKPVSSLAIILKRTDLRRSEYISFGAPPGNFWSVVSPTQGVWHRQETLRVRIIVEVPLGLGVYTLAVTTPKGVRGEQSFEVVAPGP